MDYYRFGISCRVFMSSNCVFHFVYEFVPVASRPWTLLQQRLTSDALKNSGSICAALKDGCGAWYGEAANSKFRRGPEMSRANKSNSWNIVKYCPGMSRVIWSYLQCCYIWCLCELLRLGEGWCQTASSIVWPSRPHSQGMMGLIGTRNELSSWSG